ncbi:MAG: 6-phosphofructokinase [Acidimicrobiia bacterium]
MTRFAVLTSGGDAPGMNAAVWALIKLGAARGAHVVGVERGYDGLIDGDFRDLTRNLPAGLAPAPGIAWLAGSGGTFLGSTRCARFHRPEGRAVAAGRLRAAGIEGLVIIGGNGSLTGAHLLATESDIPVVGIPASIDNDVGGTTDAIGVDTALNTIIDACDRISDTARSHRRAFILEVMGRRSGYLAMAAAAAATADAVLLPEQPGGQEDILVNLEALLRESFAPERDKRRILIIKAEGVPSQTSELADELQRRIADMPDVTVRATILGHIVRGGRPTYHDRMLAGRLALGAAHALEKGRSDVMVGWNSTIGEPTADSSVSLVALSDMLTETEAMLDGSSDMVPPPCFAATRA